MLPDFEQNRSWLRSDPSPVFPEKGEWLWEQMLEYLPDSVLVPKIDETIYVTCYAIILLRLPNN